MIKESRGIEEQWRIVKFTKKWWALATYDQKLDIISATVFWILLVCFIILLVTDFSRRQKYKGDRVIPNSLVYYSDIAVLTLAEAEAAVAFVKNQNALTFNALLTAQTDLDLAYNRAAALYEKSWKALEFSAEYPDPLGSLLLDEGIGAVYQLRAQMRMGQVQSSAKHVRSYYADVVHQLLSMMAHVYANYQDNMVSHAALLSYHALTAMAYHLAAAQRHVDMFFTLAGPSGVSTSSPSSSSAIISYLLKEVNVNLQSAQVISHYLLHPQLTKQEKTTYTLRKTLSALNSQIRDFSTLSVDGQVATPITLDIRNVLGTVRQVFQHMQDDISRSHYKAPRSNHYIAYFVLSSLVLIVSLAFVVQCTIFDSLNVEKMSDSIHSANVMHDVLVRVTEHVQEIASFSLKPPPPPRSLLGTKVGIIETQFQNCLASLRALAPTLPALLFPARMQAAAAEFSEVKDPATMMLAERPRPNLIKERLALLKADDTGEALYAAQMAAKTALQESVCEAALVFFSLAAFHDSRKPDKAQFAKECFRPTVSLVEECVYEFGGVVLFVALNKVVAVWNWQTTQRNHSEQAASCALVLASRLATLRKHKRVLRENLQVHIGVVGGIVKHGIFGTDAQKKVLLLGPPLVRGMFVALANRYHMTTVACDDYIRQSIEKLYLCKPIELIPEGGCVFEIMHGAHRGEPEKEAQLLVYKKAFDLFTKRYYREALKAFRAYTKEYGYDSSVERIQALITGVSDA